MRSESIPQDEPCAGRFVLYRRRASGGSPEAFGDKRKGTQLLFESLRAEIVRSLKDSPSYYANLERKIEGDLVIRVHAAAVEAEEIVVILLCG
jgi:hypothetical protein